MAICVHCVQNMYIFPVHTQYNHVARTLNGANGRNSFELNWIDFEKGEKCDTYSIYGVANFNNTYAYIHAHAHTHIHT